MRNHPNRSNGSGLWSLLGWRPKFFSRGASLWRSAHRHLRQTQRRRFLRMEPLEERRVLAAGALDATFGTGGLVTTEFFSQPGTSEQAYAVEIQPDGKILAAGDGDVLRDARRRRLDSTFGDGGRAVVTGTIQGIAVQSDGKISLLASP